MIRKLASFATGVLAKRFVNYRHKAAFIAKAAWRYAPYGESAFAGVRVNKRRKTLAITKKGEDIVNGHEEDILLFPKPEHFEKLDAGARHLVAGGPSADNASALGSIFYMVPYDGIIEVRGIQAHYKIGKPPLILNSFHQEHASWRVEALKELISRAREKKKNIKIPFEIFQRYDEETKEKMPFDPATFKKELKQVCSELGIRKSENSKSIIIYTR